MRPVATSAAVYPDATEGLIEFVGVKVVEQLEDDCPKACMMKEPSSIAVQEQESGDMIKTIWKDQKAFQEHITKREEQWEVFHRRRIKL